jgi:hypothetical protein
MQSSSSSQQPPELRDRVTISLYGTEQDFPGALTAAMGEVKNIALIKSKLTLAAIKYGREPPEIVVSVLLIPKWGEGSHFEDPTYKQLKAHYLRQLNVFLKDNHELREEKDIRIEDFYSKASLDPAEKAYLHFLEARGSNADMIKVHAIICDENRKRRHLQMDSNTKIFDFDLLYRETFGRNQQSDALNASYYDKLNQYVSAHNKIVYTTIYTTAESPLSADLRDIHIEYCKLHAKDDENEETKIEKLQKNSIYSKDFVVALEKRGLTSKKTLYPQHAPPQVIYFAVLTNKEAYRITRCVATAVNMSWASDDNALAIALKEAEKDLKQLPAIKVGDAECDYNCFANATLKHAGSLLNHGEGSYDDSEAHEQLLEISSPLEKKMIRDFIDKVRAENPHLLKAVMNTLIMHGDRGEKLFAEIFECNPREYESKIEPQKTTPRIK